MNRNAARADEAMMMKQLLAVLVVVLTPVGAGAQVPAIARVSAGGITVSGVGLVRVPVKTVQFTAQARGIADEAGALAAMRAAGVDDPVVGAFGARIANGNPVLVRGVIRNATRAKLDGIAKAAASYVLAHPGTAVDNITFNARIDDCAPSEQTARSAALTEARRKADAIAALAAVSIEGVAAVAESGGCPQVLDTPFGGGPNGLDISTLTTTITVNEYVTFAISPGTASTRRRTL